MEIISQVFNSEDPNPGRKTGNNVLRHSHQYLSLLAYIFLKINSVSEYQSNKIPFYGIDCKGNSETSFISLRSL